MSNSQVLLQTIEEALAEDASALARRNAASACRQLLAVLEAKPGEHLAQVVSLPVPVPLPGSVPPGVPQQSAVNPVLLLDTLIARLKAELPADRQPAPPEKRPLDIPFVPIPPTRGETR